MRTEPATSVPAPTAQVTVSTRDLGIVADITATSGVLPTAFAYGLLAETLSESRDFMGRPTGDVIIKKTNGSSAGLEHSCNEIEKS